MAKLLFNNARIRLTIPEAYQVHKQIIEWNSQFSEDRIPDQAVGLDPVALKLMKWAMQSWERVQMLNRWFAGTWMPRIQLDFIPALRCAAHFAIVSNKRIDTIDDYFYGGRALQRFWLTATRLGLQFQPEMTPLIFTRYVSNEVAFTQAPHAIDEANVLSKNINNLVGAEHVNQSVFLGRVGSGSVPLARSVRRSFSKLRLNDLKVA